MIRPQVHLPPHSRSAEILKYSVSFQTEVIGHLFHDIYINSLFVQDSYTFVF